MCMDPIVIRIVKIKWFVLCRHLKKLKFWCNHSHTMQNQPMTRRHACVVAEGSSSTITWLDRKLPRIQVVKMAPAKTALVSLCFFFNCLFSCASAGHHVRKANAAAHTNVQFWTRIVWVQSLHLDVVVFGYNVVAVETDSRKNRCGNGGGSSWHLFLSLCVTLSRCAHSIPDTVSWHVTLVYTTSSP